MNATKAGGFLKNVTKVGAIAGMLACPDLLSGQSITTTGKVDPSSPPVTPVWYLSGYLAVGYRDTGTLAISGGGTVSSIHGHIGFEAGSSGTVTVDGADSTWTNRDGELGIGSGIPGYGGSRGTLTISNGGTVSNGDAYMGRYSGAEGTVTVDGPNSRWVNSRTLGVGVNGTGELTISNGGTVSNTDGFIARYLNSKGTATVKGSNSTWTNSGYLSVGLGGIGELTISEGGTVFTHGYFSTIGGYNGTGTVTVDGLGSTWTNSHNNGRLNVGGEGTGRLTISNHGTVSNNDAHIGSFSGSRGAVTVEGQGSTWTNGGWLDVGYFGIGELTILGGGKVSSDLGHIAMHSGAEGTVTVDGPGSVWTNSGEMYVGSSGTATLTISNGGKVSSYNGYLSDQSGNGTVTVDGIDSTWTIGNSLSVGRRGTGELMLSDGGKVFNVIGHIGHHTGSNGEAKVQGMDSAWKNSSGLYVGTEGTGTLTISDGGTVSNAFANIGRHSGSHGTATVTGAGSTWTSNGELNVGIGGTGTLTVEESGTVEVAGAISINAVSSLSLKSGGTLRALSNQGNWIIGDGSFILGVGGGRIDTQSHEVTVGKAFSGTGSLTKLGTGTLTLTGNHAYTGATMVKGGNLVVSGSGARISHTSADFIVGESSGEDGKLTISGGAVVANSTGSIGDGSGSKGAVVVEGDGSAWTNSHNLHVGVNGTGALTISDSGKVTVGEMLSINDSSTVTLDGGALHARHLDLTHGDFRFLGGTLVANGTITGDLALPEFGSLGGNATITGDLLVSGTLAPGNSTGTLTVEGDLTLDNEAWIILELASLADYDRIAVNGGLTFGGTLMIEFLDGFTPEEDVELTLFIGGYTWSSGTFANILFSASGYEGLFDYETGSLTITVIPEPSTYALLILASAALIAMRRRRCQTA